MKIGYGHFMKDLKVGLKASKNIGGSVTKSVGFINSSITGATLRINLSKIALESIFYILLISIE